MHKQCFTLSFMANDIPLALYYFSSDAFCLANFWQKLTRSGVYPINGDKIAATVACRAYLNSDSPRCTERLYMLLELEDLGLVCYRATVNSGRRRRRRRRRRVY